MVFDQILYRLRNQITTLNPRPAYETWAATYDQRENNALLLAEESVFLPLLRSLDISNKHVLDVGCGTGRYLSHCFGRKARTIVGVDFSRQMLLRAAEKLPSEEETLLIESPAENLPFRDQRFDVGIATLVLSHCEDLSVPIGELGRVLRSRSTLLASDWHPENDLRGWKRIFEVPPRDGKNTRFAAKSHHHSLGDYRLQFERHGFVVKKILEPVIDKTLEPIFRRTNMMHVYDRYAGEPLVVIFDLQKQ